MPIAELAEIREKRGSKMYLPATWRAAAERRLTAG
jgi:hypothetical protein